MRTIREIRAEADRMSDSGYWPYFKMPLVGHLYRNPFDHLEAGMDLLSDESVALEDKRLEIRLLQCLPLDNYLGLIAWAIDAREDGRVEEGVLITLVSPGPEWGTTIALQYNNPHVLRLLEDMRRRLPDDRGLMESVDLIVTGTLASYISEYSSVGERLPWSGCLEDRADSVAAESPE